VADHEPLTDNLLNHLRTGDVVLTLGAGDIWKTGEDLLARLAGSAAGRGGQP
jgi:UDP-N-acetylmuramate--alanine ligase